MDFTSVFAVPNDKNCYYRLKRTYFENIITNENTIVIIKYLFRKDV